MNTLINFALLSTLCLVPAVVEAQGAQPSTPWFSVSIATSNARIHVGSDVKLTITFVNNTHQDLRYLGAELRRNDPVIELDVRDGGGKRVRETPYGLMAHSKDPHPWAGSFFARTAHPGDKIEEELILSKEYDMGMPGRYFVQAYEWNPKFRAVKSNSITITVVP